MGLITVTDRESDLEPILKSGGELLKGGKGGLIQIGCESQSYTRQGTRRGLARVNCRARSMTPDEVGRGLGIVLERSLKGKEKVWERRAIANFLVRECSQEVLRMLVADLLR